jgi:hypothetical protein
MLPMSTHYAFGLKNCLRGQAESVLVVSACVLLPILACDEALNKAITEEYLDILFRHGHCWDEVHRTER